VAPGTNEKTNPNAMETLSHDTVFTNCALTDEGDIWWEGMSKEPPEHLIDWRGEEWGPDSEKPSAHPNARFTVAATQNPAAAPEWQDPAGVPIDAILFGGRRSGVVPLVREAFDWDHGVFLGSIMSSETTAAAAGQVGKLRHDPFAMLPFCGYNMADYFAHWLRTGASADPAKLPRIFYVNWFRKDETVRFLWPGYGENSRVLDWICRRCDGAAEAQETPIGNIPTPEALNTEGLEIDAHDLAEILRFNANEWRIELPAVHEHFARFGDNLPAELRAQLKMLEERLEAGRVSGARAAVTTAGA
jgi:phosphoenolpyruvate carboxykinase (GTP)